MQDVIVRRLKFGILSKDFVITNVIFIVWSVNFTSDKWCAFSGCQRHPEKSSMFAAYAAGIAANGRVY